MGLAGHDHLHGGRAWRFRDSACFYAVLEFTMIITSAVGCASPISASSGPNVRVFGFEQIEPLRRWWQSRHASVRPPGPSWRPSPPSPVAARNLVRSLRAAQRSRAAPAPLRRVGVGAIPSSRPRPWSDRQVGGDCCPDPRASSRPSAAAHNKDRSCVPARHNSGLLRSGVRLRGVGGIHPSARPPGSVPGPWSVPVKDS